MSDLVYHKVRHTLHDVISYPGNRLRFIRDIIFAIIYNVSDAVHVYVSVSVRVRGGGGGGY